MSSALNRLEATINEKYIIYIYMKSEQASILCNKMHVGDEIT